MRKNLYFLMAVAAMASVSCLKEDFNAEQQPQIPADAVTITAVAENDPALKTSLSAGKVLWHFGASAEGLQLPQGHELIATAIL